MQIGIYCSDIKGAFDRVSAALLLEKLEQYGVTGKALAFLKSSLEERAAQVVTHGAMSDKFALNDMLFQGIVLGPKLWNTFMADISPIIVALGLIDLLFADDLNAFKVYDKTVSQESNHESFEGVSKSMSQMGCPEPG